MGGSSRGLRVLRLKLRNVSSRTVLVAPIMVRASMRSHTLLNYQVQ